MICIFSDYYEFYMEMIKVVVRMRIEIVVVKRVVNIFIEVSVIIKFIE